MDAGTNLGKGPIMSARRAAIAVSIALAGAAICLPPALAHGHEGRSHQAEDSAPHAAADEARLGSFTSRATARDAANAAAAVTGTEGDVGQWGPVVNWPVVGVHVALLPNGKVLAYDSIGDRATENYPVQDRTRATVWDPATGTQAPVNVDTGFNVFCSGFAHLTDGSIFLAGGNKDPQFNGIVQTHTFNPTTNTWSLGPDMVAGRWYPSVTPLRNGEMLITEGGPDMPEVRTTAGGLRALDTASLNLPLYPWLDVAPDGRAFYSGPDQTMRSLDTSGGGTWQTFGQRDTLNRSYGSRALYDVGKILVTGGGASSADARVIDINGATPQVSATAPMANGRRQHNLTVLADGSVLATGGNSSGASLVDLDNGVYAAEQWNPATGQWKTLAAQQVTRQYHSTALLLRDGRVLSSGGGICGVCETIGYLAKNAEVFTPPYLFKKDGSGELAPRPTVTAAPSEAAYGTPFSISTPEPATISKLALVRLGAVTHSVDMEQRYVPLSFTRGGGTLTATAPPNANIAPPGMYMLFAINANGVPSTARMLTITEPTPATFGAPFDVSAGGQTSNPSGPQVAVDPNGNAVFAWQRFDGANWRIQARARSATGALSEVHDLSESGQDAYSPQLAVDVNGNAVFAWTRFDGADDRAQARALSAAGALSAVQTLSDDRKASDLQVLASQPQVAGDANGNAIIAWDFLRVRQDGLATSRVHARARSATGALGPVQYLSESGQQAFGAQVAVDPNGNAVFAWQRFDGAHYRVQARARSATGALSAVQTLSASGQDASHPRVGVDANGNALVAWTRLGGADIRVQARTRSATGVLGAVQNLSESGQDASDPQLAVAPNRNAVFAWLRFDGAHYRVQARARSSTGALSAVQTLSASGQDASNPRVGVDANGNALFAWTRFGGSNLRVQARTRSATGVLGAVQNLSESGQDASRPQLAVGAGGDAATTWTRGASQGKGIMAAIGASHGPAM